MRRMWQQQACYCLRILHELLRIEFVVCFKFCTTNGTYCRHY